MKGKKVDSEFLSSFIEQCISNNKNTTEDILSEARVKISEIDMKIVEAEKLKIVRSKLLDVVHTFDKPKNISKSEDAKILPLFKIANQHICKFICDKIKNGPSKLSSIIVDKYPKTDMMFSLKQLLEAKIIIRTGDMIVRGEMFDNYIKLVLCEDV